MPDSIFLSQLVKGMAYTLKGNLNGLRIRRITSDSKQIRVGDLFVAIKGAGQDGHHYLEEAIHRGAVAVVVERPYHHPAARVLQVSDSKSALSHLASVYHHSPSERMNVIGVTGTNGKTTVTYLLEELFKEDGIGVIGTVSYRVGTRTVPADRTTPGAFQMHSLLKEMAEGKCRFSALEVSSHALVQSRVADVKFKAAIFTNLSQEHLDYHRTMRDYGEAKLKLFRNLESESWALFNSDDPFSYRIPEATKAGCLSFGFGAGADVRAEAISFEPDRMKVELSFPADLRRKESGRERITLVSPLIGRFNAYNLLAAFASGLVFNRPPEQIKKRLQRLKLVPGRLEAVGTGGIQVFVDYAHTPDSLEQVLLTVKQITKGRLLLVFGCGGDRDRGKRAQMGRVAAQFADEIFITTDNPRSEDTRAIAQDILEGIGPFSKKRRSGVRVELDRSEAIKGAILSAADQDTVLLAGKGHENYQIFKDVTIPFSDREEARRWITERETRHVSVA